VPLSRWCASSDIDLIQLLPLNDTGWQSSPYSALSAFALHPIYLRITDLPEFASLPKETKQLLTEELDTLAREQEPRERLDYTAMLEAKRQILRAVFTGTRAGDNRTALENAVQAFVDENSWVRIYAAFKTLKARNDGAGWKEWSAHRHFSETMLDALWKNEGYRDDLLYYSWLQLRADEQLRAAAAAVAHAGVLLKGDLPILINDDSADAWAYGDYFSESLRVGAPPDGENPLGQNWGLPVYHWDALRRDGFVWWRERLKQADRYYSAFRIDHVLGFFRAWCVPSADESGVLGHFEPFSSASFDRLEEYGFSEGRVRWLAEPHLSGESVRTVCGEYAETVASRWLEQVGDEDLYRFGTSIGGERDLWALDLPQEIREWLVSQWRDRALIAVGDGEYVPAWKSGECSRYAQLSDEERSRFAELSEKLRQESEELWDKQGREIIGMMRESTGMLPCAEDLGAIPDCVPGALADLQVLGLRIPRWARYWDSDGQPFIPPHEYPFQSVCAPSVHDTSTLRQWWQPHEPLTRFWTALGLEGEAPSQYDPSTARQVIGRLFEANSAICVFQLQDLLALVDGMPTDDPDQERVNVPGTMSDWNWGYRVNHTISDLTSRTELTQAIRDLVAPRRSHTVGES
jgi:4-alpha-glucanotransferase